jgi:hypothetical protein
MKYNHGTFHMERKGFNSNDFGKLERNATFYLMI